MSNDEQSGPPATDQAAAPVPAYAPAPQPRSRGRLLLAGGALGIALVAGTGGFALGHVTAGDGHDDMGRFGGPMGGQPNGPRGIFPGQPGQPGQPPGGFGDRRDDDDQQLPDDSATEGSSTTS